MQDILTIIHVRCGEALSVRDAGETVVMIPFSGRAEGPGFTGEIIGPGVDTQVIPHGQEGRLSARYMLSGQDAEGQPCRLFVQNEGSFSAGFRPRVVTDSAAIRAFARDGLAAQVDIVPGGVRVTLGRG